jgi:hypothetical protein
MDRKAALCDVVLKNDRLVDARLACADEDGDDGWTLIWPWMRF